MRQTAVYLTENVSEIEYLRAQPQVLTWRTSGHGSGPLPISLTRRACCVDGAAILVGLHSFLREAPLHGMGRRMSVRRDGIRRTREGHSSRRCVVLDTTEQGGGNWKTIRRVDRGVWDRLVRVPVVAGSNNRAFTGKASACPSGIDRPSPMMVQGRSQRAVSVYTPIIRGVAHDDVCYRPWLAYAPGSASAVAVCVPATAFLPFALGASTHMCAMPRSVHLPQGRLSLHFLLAWRHERHYSQRP